MNRERLKNFIFSAIAVVALWLAWIIAYFAVRNDYVVPSVGQTFAALGQLFTEAAFWRAFSNTLVRTLEAFAISFAMGLVFALLARFSSGVRAFFAPVISVLRTVPTLALVLILLLWTSPRTAPVIIAVLVLFPTFYIAILASLDEVKESYGDLARSFRVSAGRQAVKMYLPLAAPPVLKQMGATFSLGLKITVSGEVLSATAKSLGSMMNQAQGFLQMPRLLALTLLTIVVGFLVEGLFLLVYKLIVRWRP